MTKKERQARIAAGMLYQPGITLEELIVMLIDLGFSRKLAEVAAAAEMPRGAPQ